MRRAGRSRTGRPAPLRALSMTAVGARGERRAFALTLAVTVLVVALFLASAIPVVAPNGSVIQYAWPGASHGASGATASGPSEPATTGPGTGLAPSYSVGATATCEAADTYHNILFVCSQSSASVTLTQINLTTGGVTNVNLGVNDNELITYDSYNYRTYLAFYNGQNITIYNGTAHAVASVSLGFYPVGMTYDAVVNRIVIASSGGTLYILNPATNALSSGYKGTGNRFPGAITIGMAVNSTSGFVYLAGTYALCTAGYCDNVTVFNPNSTDLAGNYTILTIPTAAYPGSYYLLPYVAYAKGFVYAVQNGPTVKTVLKLSGSTGTTIYNLTVGANLLTHFPTRGGVGSAYNSADGYIFLPNGTNLAVIKTASEGFAGSAGTGTIYYAAYSSATGCVYGTNGAASGNVTATCVPNAPTGLSASPASSTSLSLSWSEPTGGLLNHTAKYWSGSATCVGAATGGASTGSSTKSYTLGSLTANTTYGVEIESWNVTGGSAYSSCASGTTYGTPHAPTGVTVTAYGAGRQYVNWTNWHGTISNGSIKRYASAGCSGAYVGYSTGAGNASYSVNSLTANTTYYYTVTSYNSSGAGPASACVSGTTLAPPHAPTGVTVVSWNAGAGQYVNFTVWHGTILNSTALRYVGASCSGSYTATSAGGSGGSISVTGLSANTTYSYYVISFNSSGNSPRSACVSATTLAAPHAPTGITVTSYGAGTKQYVNWTNPLGTVTNVTLLRWTGASCSGAYTSYSLGVVTTYSVGSLTANATYAYALLASNATGTGPRSACVAATTLAPAPAPTGLASPAGDQTGTAVTLTWTLRFSGAGVTGTKVIYGATCGSLGSTVTFGDVSTGTVTGLSIGTGYAFEAAATNGTGYGPYSACIHQGTVAPPTAPTNVWVGGNGPNSGKGTGKWLVYGNWSGTGTSAYNQSSWITNYRFYFYANSSTCAGSPVASFLASSEVYPTVLQSIAWSTSGGTVPNFLVNRAAFFTSGTYNSAYRYFFTVGIENAGSTGYTTSACSSVNATAAPNPVSVTNRGVTGSNVTWTYNAVNGSNKWYNPARNYTLYVYVDTLGVCSATYTQKISAGNVTTYAVTGLGPTTRYCYRVVEWTYEAASPLSGYGADPAPAAPTNVAVVRVAKTYSTLTWTPPSPAPANYTVFAGTTCGVWTKTFNVLGANSSTQPTTLTLFQRYCYAIVGWAAGLEGTLSSNAQEAVYAAVTGIAAKESDTFTSVYLSWTAPNSGKTLITNYSVEAGVTPASLAVVATTANVTYIHLTGLSAGHKYYFSVGAQNYSGLGVFGNANVPGVVTSVTSSLTITGTNKTTAALSWTLPTGANGGTGLSNVSVYVGYLCGVWTVYKSVGSAATSYSIVVGGGASYCLGIAVWNGTGTGLLEYYNFTALPIANSPTYVTVNYTMNGHVYSGRLFPLAIEPYNLTYSYFTWQITIPFGNLTGFSVKANSTWTFYSAYPIFYAFYEGNSTLVFNPVPLFAQWTFVGPNLPAASQLTIVYAPTSTELGLVGQNLPFGAFDTYVNGVFTPFQTTQVLEGQNYTVQTYDTFGTLLVTTKVHIGYSYQVASISVPVWPLTISNLNSTTGVTYTLTFGSVSQVSPFIMPIQSQIFYVPAANYTLQACYVNITSSRSAGCFSTYLNVAGVSYVLASGNSLAQLTYVTDSNGRVVSRVNVTLVSGQANLTRVLQQINEAAQTYSFNLGTPTLTNNVLSIPTTVTSATGQLINATQTLQVIQTFAATFVNQTGSVTLQATVTPGTVGSFTSVVALEPWQLAELKAGTGIVILAATVTGAGGQSYAVAGGVDNKDLSGTVVTKTGPSELNSTLTLVLGNGSKSGTTGLSSESVAWMNGYGGTFIGEIVLVGNWGTGATEIVLDVNGTAFPVAFYGVQGSVITIYGGTLPVKANATDTFLVTYLATPAWSFGATLFTWEGISFSALTFVVIGFVVVGAIAGIAVGIRTRSKGSGGGKPGVGSQVIATIGGIAALGVFLGYIVAFRPGA